MNLRTARASLCGVLCMLRLSILSTVGVVLTVVPAYGQQPGVTLSPFVSFLPVGSPSPMAGLSLSFSGGPLAVRARLSQCPGALQFF